MRYCYLLLLIALYSCKSISVSDSSTVTENQFYYKVDSLSVGKTLQTLSSDEMQGRESGTKGGEKAADYLADLLQKYKVKPYFKTYRDTLSNFEEGSAFNIVGVIEGNDATLKNEYVILGAHYDHIGISEKGINGDFINNGANDDASGVTAVSELAKYFGTHKTNKRSVL
ncbi:MAG: M28 family peptidase, partial [Pedobacter sp.]